MNKDYIKKIINIIHADFITMNGGKGTMKTLFITVLLFCGLMGFMISPLTGIYIPLMTGAFIVPMIFQNESKYHSADMFSLLPVNRRDLVRSRFILCTGIYIISCIIFYFLMFLSIKFKFYNMISGSIDILELIARNTGAGFSGFKIFNIIYFIAFSIGLFAISMGLRKYFRDSKKITEQLSIKKSGKKEYFILIFIFAVIVLLVLVVSGIIPINAALSVIFMLVINMAGALDGLLLCIVLFTIAVMSTIYKYICTILEYDEKEL